jgi:hypothetical protein
MASTKNPTGELLVRAQRAVRDSRQCLQDIKRRCDDLAEQYNSFYRTLASGEGDGSPKSEHNTASNQADRYVETVISEMTLANGWVILDTSTGKECDLRLKPSSDIKMFDVGCYRSRQIVECWGVFGRYTSCLFACPLRILVFAL